MAEYGMSDYGTSPADEPSTILYIGQHESQRRGTVTNSLLGQAQSMGYDLLTAPITTESFQSSVLSALQAHVDLLKANERPEAIPLPVIAPLTPQDTDLAPEDSNSSLIGIVSPWIDLGSPDPLIAHISRQVFNLEVAYAAFCGVSNVVVHGPIQGSEAVQYARAILEGLGLGPYLQLHVLMPMTGELEVEGADAAHLSELARTQYLPQSADEDDEEEPDLFASWETWNTITTMCRYSSKLTVALELPRNLPNLSLQSRWFSEPVRLLMFPHTTFLRNNKGYPVLSKEHQQYMTRFLRLRFPPWALLVDVDSIKDHDQSRDGTASEPTPAEAAQMKGRDSASHIRYMRHLQQTQPSRPPMERFGQGYQDYIQSPLQPLTDNLESVTYEVFEKDPVKYEWYERAIAAALKDLRAKLGEAVKPVVAIVGAGRGPLVTRALRASRSTGIPIQCCAVEKNPNAYVLIQRRNLTDPLWNKQVLIYKSDMRRWSGPSINGEIKSVHIMVSELLGSFADNELSPECLDGVQHVLHPDHGINIPQSYSAHLTPIATPRLYADLLNRPGDDTDKWETPAVVMLHQFDYLCTTVDDRAIPEVGEAWSFSHPISPPVIAQAFIRAGGGIDAGGWTGGDGKNEHNVRSCKLSFKAKERGVCHGLGAYFETVLYAAKDGKKVELSTNPVTMEEKSKDMISWFPCFFPLKTPLHVPDDAEIMASMWRLTDDRKVWYEWIVEVFAVAGKKKMRVGVSELHSSRKNGCLM